MPSGSDLGLHAGVYLVRTEVDGRTETLRRTEIIRRTAEKSEVTIEEIQIINPPQSEFLESTGFAGSFTSQLRTPDGEREVRHGATIVATGGVEYRGPEYGYGTDPRIVTQQEFEARLAEGGDLPDSVTMILCIGPAERYCSCNCCATCGCSDQSFTAR